MKLRPVKIGVITLSPPMLIGLFAALFFVGVGLGAAVASPNNATLALSICSLIGIIIWVYTLNRKGD